MKSTSFITRFILALALTAVGCGAATAVTPASVTLPDFSAPVLDGKSQPSNGSWDNVIPNALADYYTYVPYTTADAGKLGFPATCGNVAKGDTASTEDCYTITVKSFRQALSLSGIFGGGPGLVGLDGVTPLTTRAFGYGSGGPGWVPPGAAVAVTGNAPAGPLAGGIWHFPAPTIKGAFGRPIRVQWLNELPNEAPTGLDPSVDCGPNAPNCFPYNRISTHVHGAHVGPESDGLASAWFTPGFAVTGEDFVSTPPAVGPQGTYYYPMDQEASTIWYHDHAMGTTHNNTNMGMAGFWPITDANEKSLVAANVLPTGDYELGFALQDRHFDAATGDMVMPDYRIFNLNSSGCTPDILTGLADASNCPNGVINWMKAKDPNNTADMVGHFVPYNPADTATMKNGLNDDAPFGAPSATLEYFGNIPVVNGVVYGKYSVEPRVYRMRFIGGTDSRTWVMKLVRSDNNAVIPFWQIGTEQGLLNNPVKRDEIYLMGGERVDVLVDFTGIPAGTRVMMKNLGPDTPWPGYFEYKLGTVVPSVDIPEIMAFDVVPLPLGVTDNVATPSANTNLRPLGAKVPTYAPTSAWPTPDSLPKTINNTRVVSLMEITDGYGRTMPTIDARGFKPTDIPVTEIIKLNDVEQWDIVNTTVDAHPMHLHQVAFKVINRQALSTDSATGGEVISGFTPPIDDKVNQVFTPPSYTPAGSSPIAPDPWDDGWKDTVASPPGYVTRVWAKFDIAGEYVWHCHILSHEEHDMMRNFIVTDLDKVDNKHIAPAPAKLTVPATSTTDLYPVNWVGTAIPGVAYELQEATDIAFTNAKTVLTGTPPSPTTTTPSLTINKTLNNTLYYRVRAVPPAGSAFTTSVWTTAANPVSVQLPVAITTTSLPPGAVNVAYSATVTAINGAPAYTWTATGLPSGLTIDATTGRIYGTPALPCKTPCSSTVPVTVTVTDSGGGAKSAPLNLTISYTVPVAPTALKASAGSTNAVKLSWVDNANNETGFTLQRATNATFTTGLTTLSLPPNTNTYTDTAGIKVGAIYYYRVATFNGVGASAWSVTAKVNLPNIPVTITSLSAMLKIAKVNVAYTDKVVAIGGVAPYTWSATGLPPGLVINASGVISGIPLALPPKVNSKEFPVTFMVKDSSISPVTATAVFTLVVRR